MEFKELDVVTLTADMPQEGLAAGDIGAVIRVLHEPHTAYEVEFVDDGGKTIAVATLGPDQISPYHPC